MRGEEFLLVLPCATLDGVHMRIELIREQIQSVTIPRLRRPLSPVTLSIGVATFPDDGDSAAGVISNADAALYLAKEGGRNRVIFHARTLDPVR
jgi:diguanylate cyclase (GGDEF)-like protein